MDWQIALDYPKSDYYRVHPDVLPCPYAKNNVVAAWGAIDNIALEIEEEEEKNTKYVVRRKNYYVQIQDTGGNFSPYWNARDFKDATIFYSKEQAEAVVNNIKREKKYEEIGKFTMGEPRIEELGK